jgi:hypothetical protein
MRTTTHFFGVAAVALLGLAFAATADASRCVGTTLYGDRVTAANDFQARGVACKDALISAADYVDTYSAERDLKAVESGTPTVTIRFPAVTHTHNYHWTCRLAELPRREQHGRYGGQGWSYECHTRSNARMSFKWWQFPSRKCPGTGLVEELYITRNEHCPSASEFLEPKGLYETRTGTSFYETGEVPEKHYYEWVKRFYHYSGFLCISESESYRPTLSWECVQQTSFDPAAYWWHEKVV